MRRCPKSTRRGGGLALIQTTVPYYAMGHKAETVSKLRTVWAPIALVLSVITIIIAQIITVHSLPDDHTAETVMIVFASIFLGVYLFFMIFDRTVNRDPFQFSDVCKD